MPEFCSSCGQIVSVPTGFRMPEAGDTIESLTHAPGGPVVLVARVRMLYCRPCADRLLVSQFLKRAKPAKPETEAAK